MSRRLLDYDPVDRITIWHDYDETTHETSLTTVQDVEPLLDANKAAAKDASGPMGDMVHVASIPSSVQLKWLVEKGVDLLNPDHKQAVAKLLDDPEWRFLKVRNIILGRV